MPTEDSERIAHIASLVAHLYMELRRCDLPRPVCSRLCETYMYQLLYSVPM